MANLSVIVPGEAFSDGTINTSDTAWLENTTDHRRVATSFKPYDMSLLSNTNNKPELSAYITHNGLMEESVVISVSIVDFVYHVVNTGVNVADIA